MHDENIAVHESKELADFRGRGVGQDLERAPIHPLFHWNAAGQSHVLTDVRELQQQSLLDSDCPVRLLLHLLVPVVFEDDAARSAGGPIGEGVVGSFMGAIGEVVPIAHIRVGESCHLHPLNCLEDGLSLVAVDLLPLPLNILDVELDSA